LKIVLFDKLGKIGIVTGVKTYVGTDVLAFETDRDGKLIIGERTYTVSGGRAYVPIIDIIMGEGRIIVFIDKNGERFECGTLTKTGSRTIKINNPIEPCVIALCNAYSELKEENAVLVAEIKKIKNEYGVSFE
jgi:hypothetical protein